MLRQVYATFVESNKRKSAAPARHLFELPQRQYYAFFFFFFFLSLPTLLA